MPIECIARHRQLEHRIAVESSAARDSARRAASVARSLATRLEVLACQPESLDAAVREDLVSLLLHAAREVRHCSVGMLDVLEGGLRAATVVGEARLEAGALAESLGAERPS